MKLDAKKKKAILVGAIVVGLLLLVYWVRGSRAAPIMEDQPDEPANFDYGNYNVPGVVGGSQYDFGDIVTINNPGGNSGSIDTDALANKICGCINPCGQSARPVDSYAYASPFWQFNYVPPSPYIPPSNDYVPSGGGGLTSIIDVGTPRGEYTYWNRGW